MTALDHWWLSSVVEVVRDNALERVRALKAEDGNDVWLGAAAILPTPCY